MSGKNHTRSAPLHHWCSSYYSSLSFEDKHAFCIKAISSCVSSKLVQLTQKAAAQPTPQTSGGATENNNILLKCKKERQKRCTTCSAYFFFLHQKGKWAYEVVFDSGNISNYIPNHDAASQTFPCAHEDTHKHTPGMGEHTSKWALI